MSTRLGSRSRYARLVMAGGLRLLMVAILVQPACTVVRAVVPAELAETQESGPAGESESTESELASTPLPHATRCVRRCQRRESVAPGLVGPAASAATRRPRNAALSGHRLPNGLTAPLRC